MIDGLFPSQKARLPSCDEGIVAQRRPGLTDRSVASCLAGGKGTPLLSRNDRTAPHSLPRFRLRPPQRGYSLQSEGNPDPVPELIAQEQSLRMEHPAAAWSP